MCDINFDKYDDEEFFKLFLAATKETYSEYCEFKKREENLSGYSEPVFEKSMDEVGLRISSIRQQLAKASEENLKLEQRLKSTEELLISSNDDLAKANERVAELEAESMAFRAILDQTNKHHPDTDKMYVSGFNDAMRLFEDIYLGEPHHALNKFAIENQIESFSKWLCEVKFMEGLSARDVIDSAVEYQEQLRKEQASEQTV